MCTHPHVTVRCEYICRFINYADHFGDHGDALLKIDLNSFNILTHVD